ncbi:hypothetical protein [uncultured Paraglaciecola sp.]|uniref:hypothetical protein n=1 Tax=uncultured Paraglaciecola sp. TaxID=1765024 RepID=UPI002603D6CA|nr:hypothetical protein [uncultured Paraglaciecola sp.]
MDHVVLFTGLSSSISPKLRKWAYHLEGVIEGITFDEDGIDAKVEIWDDWRDTLRLILADPDPGIIMVFGHSNGVYAGNELINALEKHGITVHYYAAIDPTLKRFPSLGSNVEVVDQFNATSGIVAIGRKLSCGKLGKLHPARRFTGKLTSYTVKGSHTGIASSSKLRKIVKKSLAKVMGDFHGQG